MTSTGMDLTPDLLISIIKGLLYLIGAIIGLFIAMIGILHTSITKRLDNIEIDIKPISITLARHEDTLMIHTEDIKEIKGRQTEQEKWLNLHDGVIQKHDRQLATLK
jgi:hypothetical protein